MTRLEAEQRLRWQDPGVFLVRESESAPGEFSVSVRSVNEPHIQTRRSFLSPYFDLINFHNVADVCAVANNVIFTCVESAVLL